MEQKELYGTTKEVASRIGQRQTVTYFGFMRSNNSSQKLSAYKTQTRFLSQPAKEKDESGTASQISENIYDSTGQPA